MPQENMLRALPAPESNGYVPAVPEYVPLHTAFGYTQAGTRRAHRPPLPLPLDPPPSQMEDHRFRPGLRSLYPGSIFASYTDLRSDSRYRHRPAGPSGGHRPGCRAHGSERRRSVSRHTGQDHPVGFRAASGGPAFQTCRAFTAAAATAHFARPERSGSAQEPESHAAAEYLSAAHQLPLARSRACG